MRILRLLIGLPVLLLLVLFALSNRQGVAVGLWPTDFTLSVPLALAVLVPAAIACLAGALAFWLPALLLRRRLRRAEASLVALQADLTAARLALAARPSASPPQPSPPQTALETLAQSRTLDSGAA